MPDAVTELRSEMEAIATDPELDASGKATKLRVIRDTLDSLLGQAQSYLGDAQLQQESGQSDGVRAKLSARRKADLRETVVALGDATPEQMDAVGFYSHQELDRLAEEGLLEEALYSIEVVPPFSLTATAWETEGDPGVGVSLLPWLLEEATTAFEERLHPRNRLGKWRPKPEVLWRRYAELGRRENREQAEVSDVEQQILKQFIERHEPRRGKKESRPSGGGIRYTDLRGEQHVHTRYSDGHSTIEDLVKEAERRGHEHLVISDHAHHMTSQKVRRQHAEIDALNEKYAGKVRIIKGIEANVEDDGTVDFGGGKPEQFEHINVGLHKEKHSNAHERLMNALDTPGIHVLAHPHTSDGVDYDALAEKAAAKGVALEVNARDMLRNQRDDHATEMIRAAKKHGAKLQFSSDAHSGDTDFTDTRYGVQLAAKEGVMASDIYHASYRNPGDTLSVVGKDPVKPDLVKLVRDLGLAESLKDPPMGEKAKKLLGDRKSTLELYAPDGTYTPGRKEVHDKLLDEAFAGAKSQPEGKRVALFMAGGGASGKSVALRRSPELKPEDAVSVNPDEFKLQLPEWDYLTKDDPPDPYAAHMLHEESSQIGRMALDRALEQGNNIVVDAVGNSKPMKFAEKLRRAKEAGYEVRVIFVDAPTNLAIERNITRATTPGHPDQKRFVPIEEQKQHHRSAIQRIPDWWEGDFVDSWEIYRTIDLDNPIHVASGGAGKKRTVHDQGQMDDLFAKPHEEDA